MGYSCRRFLITPDDVVYRLANTQFDRMLRDPGRPHLTSFAGQRVRMADMVIEVADRVPVSVVRTTFAMLTFDAQGRFDIDQFSRQQLALVDAYLAPVIAPAKVTGNVVEASSRFVAQGGAWSPTPLLAKTLLEAALGRLPCRGLKVMQD
jgi:hypothetical protein